MVKTTVEAARLAALALHAEYMEHIKRPCCGHHAHRGLCPTGQRLLDAADDAGKRWEMAEARMARDAVGVSV